MPWRWSAMEEMTWQRSAVGEMPWSADPEIRGLGETRGREQPTQMLLEHGRKCLDQSISISVDFAMLWKEMPWSADQLISKSADSVMCGREMFFLLVAVGAGGGGEMGSSRRLGTEIMSTWNTACIFWPTGAPLFSLLVRLAAPEGGGEGLLYLSYPPSPMTLKENVKPTMFSERIWYFL